MTIVYFILIFCLVVVAHEFGHFLLAKVNGINVVEFGIGMGPKLCGFKKNGTDYVIRLIPIGGACVFENEDTLGNTDTERIYEPGSFPAASVWARISTVVAGPIFNFILGFILAMVIVWYTGSDKPTINGIMEGYPAEEAGLMPGDVITHMNGERIYLAREIYINTYVNKEKDISITYERDGKSYDTLITPKYNEEEDRYLIGLQGYGEYVECKDSNLIPYTYYEVRYCLKATLKSLGMLISGEGSKDDVSGPIGIAQVIGEVSEEAEPYGLLVVVINMLNIALLLSVNLGVMNLLPLPALDGGRLVFLLIEALRGKPVPPDKEGMVHLAGFVALMILMVFVMYNDIVRLFA